MVAHVKVQDHVIGDGEPCFVIAEAGVNHNGDIRLALQLVDAAADAGADAVKFQTFKAMKLVTESAPKAEYQVRNTGNTESQLEMLRRLELSPEAHLEILDRCRQRGIVFLSTPFDDDSADLLESLNVPAFKVSSGDLTNLPLLRYLAIKRRPLIVSTGMATLGEVEEAVRTLEEADSSFALLQCISNYPAPPSDVNLRAMATMRTAFGVPVGYSDHTAGTCVSVAAVALGASIIEKHFTLDRTLPGPDHVASLEPDELRRMVQEIREVESALGSGRKVPAACELKTAEVARKSLVAARDIPPGTELTEDMIAIKRPGTGLPPSMRRHLLNRRTKCAIAAGSLFRLENVA